MKHILSFKFYYNWWKNVDKLILSTILLLFFLGLFFSLASTSLIASDKLNTNSYYFFYKHFAYIFLGLVFILFFSSINQDLLFKISWLFFFTFLIFLILVPIIGVEVKGSKRWIDIGMLPRFQPIEILKPFYVISLALILCSERIKNKLLLYLISFVFILPIIFLLLKQPDIGQTLLITITWFSLIFISGINLVVFSTLLFAASLILILLILLVPRFYYIRDRIGSFFDISNYSNTFQSDKASEAIISGGFFGRGIGEGVLKNRVPEAHTDYIIAVISEEFGIIVIVLLMLIFLFLIYIILKRLALENENKIKLALTGLITLISLQILIHIGVNIRMFPTTGMTLPFLSYGGSSIIGTSIITGVILNLTKRKL